VKILITGSDGFLAKNLIFKLNDRNIIYRYSKNSGLNKLEQYTKDCDIVYHLASEIKSNNKKDFKINNVELTEHLSFFLQLNKNKSPIIYSSTHKINHNSIYAKTKKNSEAILLNHSRTNKSKICILRFPNIFGKWSKPNHNSFLATICHNITRNIKLKKINKFRKINLIYIDNATDMLVKFILKKNIRKRIIKIKADKQITVLKLLEKIQNIWLNHQNSEVVNTHSEFDKNLYTTLISYLPIKYFKSIKKKYSDRRGFFCELVKTSSAGQFNLFTVEPKETRGGHYHHSKHEKFFLISGKALFIKKNLLTGKIIKIKLDEKKIIEVLSVPGWWHEVKNTSNKPALFLLWSNEIFNVKKPDTYKLEI